MLTKTSTCMFMVLFTASTAASLERSEMIKEVQQLEERVSFLKFHADKTWDSWDAENGKWLEDESHLVMDAVLSSTPVGKVFIDVLDQKTRWEQGAAPYYQEAFTIAYNGQIESKITHRAGLWGKTLAHKEREVRKERSIRIESLEVDLPTSMTVWRCLGNRRLSDLLLDENADISISEETLEGIRTIRLDHREGSGWVTKYWFDPARTYTVLRIQRCTTSEAKDPKVMTETNTTHIEEIEPGLYFPTEVVGDLWPDNPNTKQKFVIKASGIDINPSEVNEDTFILDFAKGYVLSND